jgi:2-C-methyl-D-erythritol 4-phosphate cytidylyltransferase
VAERADAPGLLASVSGVPMLLRAVRGLLESGVVDHVVVLVPPEVGDAAARLLGGEPVIVHADPREAVVGVVERLHAHTSGRATSGRGRVGGPPAPPSILLHDAARVLAPPALARAVAAAVRDGHGVAVPVLPLSDTVKDVDPGHLIVGSPDRGTLRVVQTPQAYRPDLLGPEVMRRVLSWPGPVEQAWTTAGEPAVTVPGHPLGFPVRSAWDRELAEVLTGA